MPKSEIIYSKQSWRAPRRGTVQNYEQAGMSPKWLRYEAKAPGDDLRTQLDCRGNLRRRIERRHVQASGDNN